MRPEILDGESLQSPVMARKRTAQAEDSTTVAAKARGCAAAPGYLSAYDCASPIHQGLAHESQCFRYLQDRHRPIEFAHHGADECGAQLCAAAGRSRPADGDRAGIGSTVRLVGGPPSQTGR